MARARDKQAIAPLPADRNTCCVMLLSCCLCHAPSGHTFKRNIQSFHIPTSCWRCYARDAPNLSFQHFSGNAYNSLAKLKAVSTSLFHATFKLSSPSRCWYLSSSHRYDSRTIADLVLHLTTNILSSRCDSYRASDCVFPELGHSHLKFWTLAVNLTVHRIMFPGFDQAHLQLWTLAVLFAEHGVSFSSESRADLLSCRVRVSLPEEMMAVPLLGFAHLLPRTCGMVFSKHVMSFFWVRQADLQLGLVTQFFPDPGAADLHLGFTAVPHAMPIETGQYLPGSVCKLWVSGHMKNSWRQVSAFRASFHELWRVRTNLSFGSCLNDASFEEPRYSVSASGKTLLGQVLTPMYHFRLCNPTNAYV